MISTLTGVRRSRRGRAAAAAAGGRRGSVIVVEGDRAEDRHGHVEAVGQVAVGIKPVAVPERCAARAPAR